MLRAARHERCATNAVSLSEAAQLAVAPEPAQLSYTDSSGLRRAGPVNLNVGRLLLIKDAAIDQPLNQSIHSTRGDFPMKTTNWSRTSRLFIGLAMAAGCLILISTSFAQWQPVKLTERQILEAGFKRGASKVEGSKVETTTGNQPSPIQGKIAFTSSRSGKRQIFVMNADGSTNQTAALTDKGENWKPAFSRDGKKIAFVSNRDGNTEIYLRNSDGSGEEENITKNSASDEDPCFSPDGKKLAFHSNRADNNYEIYTVDLASKAITRLTNSRADDYGPTWFKGDPFNAGGTKGKIAWHHPTGEILVMNEDGSNPDTIISGLGEAGNASWSPDGSRITFWAKKDSRMNIFVVNFADKSRPTQVTDGTSIQRDPCWSLDGKRIVFESNAGGTYDIYSVDAAAKLVVLTDDAGRLIWKDGTNSDKLRQLTDNPASERHPSCGP